MKKIYLLLLPVLALCYACESDTPDPALRLDVRGGHLQDVLLGNEDIPLTFEIISDKTADRNVQILLALDPSSTARLNEHFVLENPVLQIEAGNSKAYGKLTILQENFEDGDAKTIRLNLRSNEAVFSDTAYIEYTIKMGDIRIPRPEYCLPESNWGMYAGINGFEFAGISNSVLVAEEGDYFAGSCVVNYTAQIGEAVVGSTYEYTLVPDWYKTGANDVYEVVFYIDWNKDGDFGDEGEEIFRREIVKATAVPQKGEITIPDYAVPGITGIRVGFFAKPDSELQKDGCGYVDSGEFEDYSLLLKAE